MKYRYNDYWIYLCLLSLVLLRTYLGKVGAEHGVRLARTALSIGQHTAIVSFKHPVQYFHSKKIKDLKLQEVIMISKSDDPANFKRKQYSYLRFLREVFSQFS